VKITTSIILSFVVLVVGLVIKGPFLWIPITVFAASIIDVFVREWVMSDRMGLNSELSALIKLVFMVIMTYSSWGQIACLALVFYWFYQKQLSLALWLPLLLISIWIFITIYGSRKKKNTGNEYF
jgi:hypothetical protein